METTLVKSVVGVLLLSLILFGCSKTSVVLMNDTKYPPAPKRPEILTSMPNPDERPYIKIALLESSGDKTQSSNDLLNALIEKAQDLGANAVVITEQSERFVFGGRYSGWYKPIVRGVAIKFK